MDLMAVRHLRAPGAGMPCPRCGGLMREDTQFTSEMSRYGLPQRRYVCYIGHSHYPVRVVIPPVPNPSSKSRSPQREPRDCVWCGDHFLAAPHQTHCSAECVKAKNEARDKARSSRRPGPTMSGEALRAVRAMKFWPKGAPVPYAQRADRSGRS